MDNYSYRIIGEMKYLPQPDLTIALGAANKSELFVAGYYNYTEKHLLLFKGDGNSLIIPAEWFEPNEKFLPDFGDLSLTDGGQTVRLGVYEVSSQSIFRFFNADSKGECTNEVKFRTREKISN